MQAKPVGGVTDNQGRLILDYFIYSTSFSALAAASEASQVVNIEADAAFVIQSMTAAVFDDAETIVANPLLTVQLVDTGAGRSLFDDPQLLGNVTGTGQRPFYLPISRLFAPNSNLNVLVENLTAAEVYNVYISFIGHKLFSYKANGGR